VSRKRAATAGPPAAAGGGTPRRLGAEHAFYHFDPAHPPAIRVSPGEELWVDVQDAFGGERDVEKLPVPWIDEPEGHPTPPATGPVYVEGALPGHTLVVDILEITTAAEGVVAIQRNAGFLPERFPTPRLKRVAIKDGVVLFDGLRIPAYPNFGTFSTTPASGGRAGLAGVHGGDLDQKEVAAGNRVWLPIFVPGALFGLGDPHAVISDSIACGTGVECAASARLRFSLRPESILRPRIETPAGLSVVGFGPDLDTAARDAIEQGLALLVRERGMEEDDAYMLLSLVGDLVIGTSPRPIMGVRLVLPKSVLAQLG
jgi:amidase